MILPMLLLLATLGGGTAAPEAGELRSYDLQPLLVPYHAEFELQVLPCRGAGPGSEEREHLDAGLVIELVRALCSPEFEYEGRMLQESGGALYVTAPAAVQERVARILAFLGGTLATHTDVLVDELLLPEPLSKDPAALLAPEEAQKLIAGAGPHRAWKLQLRPGWAGAALSLRSISFVSDWNVEIAQGAAIYDPIVDCIPVGDALVCSGASAPGGLWLALLARCAESSGPKDHPLEVSATVASDASPIQNPQPNGPTARAGGRVLQAGPRLWQSVPVSLHGLALNTFLPDGKVLCVSATLGVGEQKSTRLLLVRRAGTSTAPVQGLAFDPKGSGGRDLVLVDGGWLRPPYCALEGDLRGGGALPQLIESEQGPLKAFLHAADTSRAHELLQTTSGCDVFDSSAWLVLVRSPRPVEGSGREAALTRLGAGAPTPQAYSVELALRRGGTLVARSSLALRSGVASSVVAGAEDQLLADWDVEVAQFAAVGDPQIRESFEGLCARLRVDRDGAGGVLLDIRAFGQVRSGELRNLDPQVPTVGPMSQGSWDRLGIEERVTLGGEGAKKVGFGDTGGNGLMLEVTLNELK